MNLYSIDQVMDDKKEKVRINTFNCGGLRGRGKRLNVFHWLIYKL